MKKLFFSIFLKLFVVATNLYAIQNVSKVPTTTKEIEFTLEVLESVGVEPLWLDFGNILKNSNFLYKAQSYLNIEGKFKEDMYVSTSFDEGIREGDYTKIQIGLENTTNSSTNEKLDVYIKNMEKQIIKMDETKLPVLGEIRNVGNIELGKYNKTIKMNVVLTPVSPIK